MPTPGSTTSCSSSTETCSKVEAVRRTLYRLLPSQADCDILICRANRWWYLHKYVSPSLEAGKMEAIPPIAVEAVQSWHPAGIARLLLALTLCVQQSSQDSQLKVLEMSAPYTWMEKCVTTVANLVTSDDELIGTVEGLECLVLMGSFQLNVGNMRRAWLHFRRALNIAQLMGLHRFPANKLKRDRATPLTTDDIRRSYIYSHLVKGDIYL